MFTASKLDSPLPFWSNLYADLEAQVPAADRTPGTVRYKLKLLRVVIMCSGLHVAAIYRLAHLLYHRAGLVGKIAIRILYWFNRHWYGVGIAAPARIHGGFVLPHPRGVFLGRDIEIGPRCWIFQHVTIGGAPEKTGMPRIGSDVRIFTGAVLSGPISIGDNVMVGANAVVAQDIPANSVVRLPSMRITQRAVLPL